MWSRKLGVSRHMALMVALMAVVAFAAWPTPAAFARPLAGLTGTITINPVSGPVGTAVTADIHLTPTTPTQYILAVTMTDPNQTECQDAQRLPGVDPVTIGSQGASVTFDWPSAFGSGDYWLCALTQDGNGQIAYSNISFTVTSGTPATATPVHGGGNGGPSAAVLAPAGGAHPGATVSIIVTGWATSDDSAPTTLTLIDESGAVQPLALEFTVVANPSPGDFTLKVMLPATLALGRYAFALGSAYSTQTEPFAVAAPVAPTATPGATASPGPAISSKDGGGAGLVIGLAVAVLLVLAVASLLVARQNQRRQEAAGQRDATYEVSDGRRSRDGMWRW